MDKVFIYRWKVPERSLIEQQEEGGQAERLDYSRGSTDTRTWCFFQYTPISLDLVEMQIHVLRTGVLISTKYVLYGGDVIYSQSCLTARSTLDPAEHRDLSYR